MASIKIKGDTSGEIVLASDATSTKLTCDKNIDIQGNELVLDADADTSITADTDDQVDIKIGGTDRFKIASTGEVTVTHTVSSGGLDVVCTDGGTNGSELELYHNSDSAADNDTVSFISSRGNNSADEKTTMTQVRSVATDITDGTEDASMKWLLMSNGTLTERAVLDNAGNLDVDGSLTSSGASNAFGNMQVNGSGGAGGVGFTYVYSSSTKASINNLGNLTISGALSKGSGSFKIDHPLPAKSDTHNLVHSFVEAPQADNIYRGKVDLVAGTATINIDTSSSMTDGTFVLLNTDVQCFTTNETGWTSVKGSVSGNTLTITAEDNTCTDTISWMVIGERKDQHMIDTDWTDENGKVIVEPLKEEE